MDINRVVMTARLTRDPDLRSTASGTPVCNLRVACGTQRKDSVTGEWVTKPNFFDVTVWGGQAESAARYLSKGRQIAIDGHLEWREWETHDASKRQAVEIIAEHIQFLAPHRDHNSASDISTDAEVGAEKEPVAA